jgi:peptidoglycan/xylan/chitin deacetylase (PgdA/CDA1 family)
MGRGARRVAVSATTAALLHALPAITSWPSLRHQLLPGLAGVGTAQHVALTFDDGPDPLSTPHFLRLLESRHIHATFFLLGRMVARAPLMAAQIRDAGHEIGLHGYGHRCLLLRGPGATYDDLARGRDAITAATGTVPRWYRPPYGVLTTATVVAATRLDLIPVLWTAWGRDWSRTATPTSVLNTVTGQLRGGGTVLLHDSDCTSAPGSWKNTLSALPPLLDHCDRHGWSVGPLGEHGLMVRARSG